jgi:hypothetical protein
MAAMRDLIPSKLHTFTLGVDQNLTAYYSRHNPINTLWLMPAAALEDMNALGMG